MGAVLLLAGTLGILFAQETTAARETENECGGEIAGACGAGQALAPKQRIA
jgi:hypothetical protein